MIIIDKLLSDLSTKISRPKPNYLGPGERKLLGANCSVTQGVTAKMDEMTVLTIEPFVCLKGLFGLLRMSV